MNNPKVIPKKNESSPNIQSDNNMLAVPQKNANGRPTSSRPTSSRPKSALRKAG